ncbi:MAG: phage baseplate assembly protein V [Tannerellaceae bacterium]|nr:phage baseplate assembly protein V [Tannerellaceae bacterium]
MSKHFNGNIYVGFVQHEIQDGNWFTTIGMGISPENITEKPDVIAPAASGLLPGIQGLHIGKVSKLEDDPLSEFRIEVELPLLNGEKNKVWARLAQGIAGKQSGFFFLPDAGDEVIVGFFNNDPCQAVILGSLYSSKQAPPYDFKNDNNTRAIYTRSKNETRV